MTNRQLRRELGLPGAIVTGLGSIVGTGAFVAIGIASSRWGDLVIWAIPLAALVAVFNGLSSAFLAGRFPMAGGTYEYGYRALNPWLGFAAGWLFLLAKSASAATAALGVALYLGLDGIGPPLIAVAVVALLVLSGIRRTAFVNGVLVTVTVATIVWFGISGYLDPGESVIQSSPESSILGAIAFLFVAYTGYGRIATLGEEVKDPVRIIPRAVIITLAVAATLYMIIELGGRARAGDRWGAVITLGFIDDPFIIAGAVTAMLGVLLNLILGLSRVWLAMGRRGDMPRRLAGLDRRDQPNGAIVVSALVVGGLTLIGDIAIAWSFSAMTVLLYYGITNLSALAVDRSRITAWLGFASCVFLSFFVPLAVWLIGALLIVAGLVWKGVIGLVR